ncbi:DNA-3-methyladenine glycosylase [Nocardioides albertanoniae]|uniref:Putative 3-methyladenine DNA glycosylase n=1 Tax=Nocardioides albertanoniae TaxID=1175486 RepID=A0A543A815_9ACTN|nr:DNA-3-methyladenine glycosylase [Nocardioides albertanoniae]TQL68742.1 DNA-3-methyladenine glycosylase [Nocardioides albertanoniae]
MSLGLPDLTCPVTEVAPGLLGCLLGVRAEDGWAVLRITEVEAYGGDGDPASHAYKGVTPRNQVMFGPAGHLYVYRSHGIHWCANVVTGREGEASAVLLRAGEVVEGSDVARQRRGERPKPRDLARGPGNLARALGINADHDGADLLGQGAVRLEPPATAVGGIERGPRVGISRAADRPWRWWLGGEPSVSAYRKAVRRVRTAT